MDLAHRLADLTAPTGEEKLLNVRYPTPRLRITPRHGLFVVAAAAVDGVGPQIEARTGEHCRTCRVKDSCPVQVEGRRVVS